MDELTDVPLPFAALAIDGVLLVFGLLMIAFFSLSEAALVGASKAEVAALADRGHKRGRLLEALTENPERVVTGLILGLNLGMLLMANVLAHVGEALDKAGVLAYGTARTELYVSLVAAGIIVLFGEIIPKSYAAARPLPVALATSLYIRRMNLVLSPIVAAFEFIAYPLVRLLGGRRAAVEELSSDEIRDMVSLGEEAGAIEADEREMIYGILEFADTTVHEIMIPRIDTIAIEASQPLSELLRLVEESGHTRLPVYAGSVDDLLGIVHYRDAAEQLEATGQDAQVRGIVRKAPIVPETKKLAELLRELKAARSHLALVVNEHGGFVGIVTIEDILEEIVGEIADEHDSEAESIRAELDGTLEVRGNMDLEDFAKFVGIELPEGDYETLAGFIIEQLGHIPEPGERLVVGKLELTIKQVARNRIESLQARAVPEEDEDEAED
jgi:CBS domain containing-hemolysin-like protein